MNGLAMRRAVHGAIRSAGDRMTVTLRRRHSLLDPVAGKPPATLLLNGAHAQDAVAVNLKTAGKLAGRLVAGLRLTIGGEQYEVGGQIVATGNALASVPIAPGLGAAAADGDAVLVEAFRDYTFTACSAALLEQLVDGSVRGGQQDLLLAAEDAPTTPQSDDVLLLGGIPSDALEVVPYQPGDTVLAWRVKRGGRAA